MEIPTSPAASTNTTPQLNQKSPKRKLYLTILLGILLVLALLAFVWFRGQVQAPPAPEQTKVATQSAANKAETENFDKVYVSADEGLNLREEASTSALIILLLPKGTELKVISTQGDWYFVEAQTKGFVNAEFITKTKPSGITLATFTNPDSAFKFLYPDVYKVELTTADNLTTYNFSGNESFGGFKVETTEGLATLGNYALKNYPQAQKGSCEPLRFGTQSKECEKVVDSSGTLYLLLVNTTLYKITYLKTEGGLLVDINNLVFYSLYFD